MKIPPSVQMFSFLYFLLLDESDKNMCVGINQMVKGEILTTEEG
jgi:hypothetical protein